MSEPAQPNVAYAQQVRVLVLALYAAGVITIAVGIAVGIAIDPVLFADRGRSASRLRARPHVRLRAGSARWRRSARRPSPATPPQVAEADPSFNPYARED